MVELTEEAKAGAVEQAKRFDVAGLTHMIALCESVGRSAKSSSFPRAIFDALMVRLAQSEKIADVAGLIASGHAGNGAASPAAAGGPAAKKR